MLALAKQARLRAGQDERKASGRFQIGDISDGWFDDRGKRRVAVLGECLGPELDFSRRGWKSARVAALVQGLMFQMRGCQRHPQSARRGPKLIEGKAARRELCAIGRL